MDYQKRHTIYEEVVYNETPSHRRDTPAQKVRTNDDSYNNITVMFEDGTILNNVRYNSFKTGGLIHPSLRYYGAPVTRGPEKEDVHTRAYYDWYNMLNKCHGPRSECRTYDGCIICPEWYDYQNYKAWHEENFYTVDGEPMVIDKDILDPYKRPKAYGSDTCLCLPQRINLAAMQGRNGRKAGTVRVRDCYAARVYFGKKLRIIGIYSTPEEAFEAYKAEKEKHVRSFAKIYKDVLPEHVIQAILVWEYVVDDEN